MPSDRNDDRFLTLGRIILLLVTGRWTLILAVGHSDRCFMDLVNLAFHEAGHVFLTPFGETMHFLGGSFGQLFVPALLIAYFLFRRPSLTGAAFCTWWLGESFVNVAYYMADARELAMPLVGGGVHDWNWIFFRFDLLDEPSVHFISGVTHGIGVTVMLAGLMWMAFFLLSPPLQDRIVDRIPERLRTLCDRYGF